jgi:5'-nucleotidase
MKMRQIASGLALIFAVTNVAHAIDNEKNHKKPNPSVIVKIVAINDFHGQLESPGSLRNVPATSELPNPLTTYVSSPYKLQ